jgi:tetratricopeptide (TPR) repeat protein
MAQDVWYDKRGVSVTAASQAAVDALDAATDAYLGFRRDAGDRLKAVFAADPDMVMAHVIRGYFMNLMGNRALMPRAEKAAAEAEARAGRPGSSQASEREHLHVAALNAWNAGEFRRAAVLWEEILLTHPRDMFAMRLAHFAHFYLGQIANHRDSLARVMGDWNASVPGYQYVLGMRAFGLEEAGQYAEAERYGRQAVELDPTDTWSIHSVAHVLEMTGRAAEGIAWIERDAAQWDGLVHNFANHVWWHKAMFHLQLDDVAGALSLYDRRFWAVSSDDYLDQSNAAAMLMRLEFRGVDVGDRWQQLAELAAARVEDQVLPFADAHFMLALAGRNPDRAEALLDNISAYCDAYDNCMADSYRRVGLPLAAAIEAYGRRAYAQAVDLLLPIRYDLTEIGGSHAQRDVFHQLLIQAATGAGQHRLARALLLERTAQMPHSLQTKRDLAAVEAAIARAA